MSNTYLIFHLFKKNLCRLVTSLSEDSWLSASFVLNYFLWLSSLHRGFLLVQATHGPNISVWNFTAQSFSLLAKPLGVS